MPDTVNLFTYGTLMQVPLMIRICRNSQLTAMPATLDGFQRRCLRNRNYPGLIAKRGSVTRGIIYRGLNKSQLTRLDDYEGVEYDRIKVTVRSETGAYQAWCYLLREEYHHLILPRDWQA